MNLGGVMVGGLIFPLFWERMGGSRESWMWGRFTLLVLLPLEVQQLLKLLSAWTETHDFCWSGLFGRG